VDELSALQASGLFGESSLAELSPLLPALRRRAFARGAYLWHAGDPTGLAVVVLTGLLKSRHIGSDGRELVISLCGPLESVGGYHLFETDTVRKYDAIAVERSECVVIARDMLMYQLEHNARLVRRLAASLLRMMVRETAAAMETPAAGDLEGRLTHRLLELAARHGQAVDGGVLIPFALTQSLLAGLVGGSREKVNRALSRLVDEGMVSRGRTGVLTLRNPGALRRQRG
jgi:CRP/FNR family transcriptional regulator, cyclic AMP receptor protein